MNEEVIRYLPFPDNVRKRPSMYLGGLENASVPLREICDNSCDIIAESGIGDTILVSNDFNGFLFVADNSLGIPISMSIDKPDGSNYSVNYLDKKLIFNNFLLKINDQKFMIVG